MARALARGWPYGSKTKLCDRCQGTGAPRGSLVGMMNRADRHDDPPRACEICRGRGRVVDFAAACVHNLLPKDCAICTRDLGGRR